MAVDIASWLDAQGFGAYQQAFAEHEIDLDVVGELTESDLAELGLPIGARKRLIRSIRELLGEPAAAVSVPPVNAPGDAGASAEHRHLSIMFCDLVGSTALSESLDPETLRDVIAGFRDACADVVAHYEGFLASYLGDGMLIYFGYPQAREHEVECAVRAGLAMINAVGQLVSPVGVDLQIRVGIATGYVVAGDLVGSTASEALSVLGDMPNLAARLQSVAQPNTLIVSDSTRRLVQEVFNFEDLGQQMLKGFSEPVTAWRVLGESAAPNRFDATVSRELTALVGRVEEIDLFSNRWRLAANGEGQVILLTADPGVGKSRILSSFIDGLKQEKPGTAYYFCSPFHRNSPLQPIIGQIEKAAGIKKGDGPGRRLDKLEALLEPMGLIDDETATLFAEMLGLPAGTRYPPLDLSPQRKRAKTFDAIGRFLKALSSAVPTLAVFEDVHWVDPTTLELLGQLIERLREDRVLLVVTFRPEFKPPWSGRANITVCSLNRLGRRDSIGMITAVAGGKPLPDEVNDIILERTDGVPLFVEELTKNLLESGYLEEAEDQHILPQPLPVLAIPESLHDSLLARLDTLAAAKELAQIAAVIGRLFPHELIAAVSPLRGHAFDEAIEKLIGSGLVSRQGYPPEASYEFKHALIQDAAYESLLRSRRHEIHGAIAAALETDFADLTASQPEILAHHFSEATLAEKAVPYWQRAGTQAVERSANREAIAHARAGLRQLDAWPDGDERRTAELSLQLTLGPALMTIHGYASAGVMDAYTRAHDLAEALDDTARLFTATWGMWLVQQQGGNINHARLLADEVLALAERLGEIEYRLQAHHAVWTTAFRLGKFSKCLHHAEQGIALFDVKEHGWHATLYGGHDAGVCAYNHAALSAWFLGHADQAVEYARSGVALAEELAQPFSEALAKFFSAQLYRYRGEPREAQAYAEGSLDVSRSHGFAQLEASAEVVLGWAVAQLGNKKEGIATMNQALDGLAAAGAGARRASFLPILADVYLHNGETKEALDALDMAEQLIGESGERTAETEIQLLRGELLERSGAPTAEVEAAFNKVIDLARADGVLAIELRAATALARVWLNADRKDEARELLSPIHAAFSEGTDTPDLVVSRSVLDAIQA